MQYESWIDRQIREAMERGEFDDLPGAGRPLHLDDDPDWWVKAKIARENLEPLLPTPGAAARLDGADTVDVQVNLGTVQYPEPDLF